MSFQVSPRNLEPDSVFDRDDVMTGSLAFVLHAPFGDIPSVVILSRADDEESLAIQNQRSTREVPRFARNDEGYRLTRPYSPRPFAFRATSRARILSRRNWFFEAISESDGTASANDAAPAPQRRSFQTHSFGFAHPLRHARRSALTRPLHQTSRFADCVSGARMRTQSR